MEQFWGSELLIRHNMTSSDAAAAQKHYFTLIVWRHSEFEVFLHAFPLSSVTPASCHSKLWFVSRFFHDGIVSFEHLRDIFLSAGEQCHQLSPSPHTVMAVIQWICSLFSSLGAQMTNLKPHGFISYGRTSLFESETFVGWQLINVFVIFLNLIIRYWWIKTIEIMACICFNHCKRLNVSKLYKRRIGRNRKQQHNQG